MIGREVVARILRESDAEVLALVHHRCTGVSSTDFLRDLLHGEPTRDQERRLRSVAGDVAAPRLGLSDDEYRRIGARATGILHSAATTRFDLPLEEARRVNVAGTANVLALAKGCGRLERFGFVSTAYVAGRRTGTILESEREHGEGFVNSYEQSKYEAEALIEDSLNGVPAAVYRLSTVLGDSRTGRVAHPTAPHHALRMMHLGLASMLPGAPENTVDLIPGDGAACALYRLFTDHFQAGQVLHLTAPEAGSYTLAEIVEQSYRFLAEADPAWGARRYPAPVITSPDAFELFVRSAEQANNPLMRGAMKTLRHFAHQLAYPKRFDRSRLLACLPRYDEDMPDVRSYYAKVVASCVGSGWRRHA
jgi:thioester reductase-like protein